MITEFTWKVAAGLERCAIGWRLDAARYIGPRRAWRMARAKHCEDRAYSILGL